METLNHDTDRDEGSWKSIAFWVAFSILSFLVLISVIFILINRLFGGGI
jgi:hypothetical protein